jgi:hypothetical protein
LATGERESVGIPDDNHSWPSNNAYVEFIQRIELLGDTGRVG